MKVHHIILFVFFSSYCLWANYGGFSYVGPEPQYEPVTASQQRMEKRFSVGFSVGGPLSLFGVEFDINFSEEWSFGAGVGTGLDYSTFMVKGRYLILGDKVSPYLGASLAHWWSSEASINLKPSIVGKLLGRRSVGPEGFKMTSLAPLMGVEFMTNSGFGFYLEAQYFFKLFSLANGSFAGAGMHYYF